MPQEKEREGPGPKVRGRNISERKRSVELGIVNVTQGEEGSTQADGGPFVGPPGRP